MKSLLLLLFVFSSIFIFSQSTQTVRGTILDLQSLTPIPGVNIVILESDPILGTSSDFDGNWRITDVPIGRIDIQFTAIGYKPVVIKSQLLTISKELILEVKMEEDIELLDEVVINAGINKNETINKMATVSARSFSIEETEKYAGSLGDPSRMAQNFAGVFTAGDQRNDIIIRGNSPSGLLWRLDGANIPNPNHFGALGSTGGPVSMLNNNLLTNSDFFTGAWPAEYGNSLSGVFDLNMRNGNNQQREYLFQIGFNGFEIGAEGPFFKGHQSSYLMNYRNSTLDVMDKLGFPVAGGAVPQYQDLSLKYNFLTKKFGKFSLTGIMGNSNIFFDHRDENDGSFSNFSGADTKNGSSMITYTLNHLYFFNEKSRIESFVNFSASGVETTVDNFKYTLDSIELTNTGDTTYIVDKTQFFHENNRETRLSAGTKYKSKLNSKNYIDFGVSSDYYSINYVDSVYVGDYPGWGDTYIKQTEVDTSGIILFQAYGQWNYRFTNNLGLFSGAHYQYMTNNGKWALEPRLSLKWDINQKHSLAWGYGLHSQMQSLFLYYARTPIEGQYNQYLENNKNLDFTKSHQAIISYNWIAFPDFRIKVETYYQHLYDVPVSADTSYYSVLNSGAGFHQERKNDLVNEGIGRNYGVELTLEKFFSNNFYFLITGSIFESKYKTLEDLWRNTTFNNNYVLNVLGGYEFVLGPSSLLSVNIKTVYAGGKRFIPILTDTEGEPYYDFDNAFATRTDDYFRTDLRIGIKVNMKRVTQEWALDLQNLSNHKNIYGQSYNSDTGEVSYSYQQGFYPMFLYRLTF
ncbi:MAG: TonB-dependent receptor [Bacteroidales bacterium]|nr:TonB-dependent receptor [Bacteroidales bacterium]